MMPDFLSHYWLSLLRVRQMTCAMTMQSFSVATEMTWISELNTLTDVILMALCFEDFQTCCTLGRAASAPQCLCRARRRPWGEGRGEAWARGVLRLRERPNRWKSDSLLTNFSICSYTVTVSFSRPRQIWIIPTTTTGKSLLLHVLSHSKTWRQSIFTTHIWIQIHICIYIYTHVHYTHHIDVCMYVCIYTVNTV